MIASKPTSGFGLCRDGFHGTRCSKITPEGQVCECSCEHVEGGKPKRGVPMRYSGTIERPVPLGTVTYSGAARPSGFAWPKAAAS